MVLLGWVLLVVLLDKGVGEVRVLIIDVIYKVSGAPLGIVVVTPQQMWG